MFQKQQRTTFLIAVQYSVYNTVNFEKIKLKKDAI
jgi:hypothetical protein